MILYCFIPFIAYFLTVLNYFIFFFDKEVKGWDLNTIEAWIRLLFYILWTYFTIHEVVQLYLERLDYVSDFWNYVDILSIFLNMFLVTNHAYNYADVEP